MRISNDIHYPVLELCKKVLETPIGDNMYIITKIYYCHEMPFVIAKYLKNGK